MVTSIDTFKKIYIELDISGSNQYSMTNDISYNNSSFLNFNLGTSVQSGSVTINVIQKSSINGTIENTEEFTVNYSNNILKRNVNIFTPYTLIDISNNLFNGVLNGFIEKMTLGTNVIDISGQTIAVRNGVDISGQRIDISGQRIDISGQRVDVSGNRIDVSGNRFDVSGNRVDVSGQRIDVSGQRIDVSGQPVDISGQTVDISGQTVDVSGQSIIIQGNDGTNNKRIKTDTTGNLYSIITDGSNMPQITNNSTITGSNIYGLNFYQIFPKIKSYSFNSFTTNTSAEILVTFNGASGTTLTPYTYNFGLANPRTWHAYTSASLNLNYTYVNQLGNETTNSMNINATTWTPLTGSIVSINDFKSTNYDISGSAYIYIAVGTGATTNVICYYNRWSYNIGVFTCPNNAIAWISDISLFVGGTTDNFYLWKYDTSGIRTVTKTFNGLVAGGAAMRITGGHINNPIGGFLRSGESFAWSGEKANTTFKIITSTINVLYF